MDKAGVEEYRRDEPAGAGMSQAIPPRTDMTYLHHWSGVLSWKPPNPQMSSSEQSSVAGFAVSFKPAGDRMSTAYRRTL